MKIGTSWILDKAIGSYMESVEAHIKTQQQMFVSSAALDDAENSGIGIDPYKNELLNAAVDDIEASYNHNMREKLMDIMVDLEKTGMIINGNKNKNLQVVQ